MGAVAGPVSIEAHLRRVGLRPEHAKRLRSLQPLMDPLAYEMALAFYDHLGQDPHTRAILWSEAGRVERLYKSFETWYRELFSGNYDDAYAVRRWRVGKVHARFGVPLSLLTPAIGQVYSLALEHLLSTLRPGDLPGALDALGKVLTLDITLMAVSYEVLQAAGELPAATRSLPDEAQPSVGSRTG